MKIISFSLWGEDHKYCIGAVRNAELAQSLFPDWVCRFYVADDVPIAVQGALANLDNVDMFDMPIEYDGWRGMFSRFLPATEDDVEVMVSRDCDSRLSVREANAVNEWLESDKGFHIMRDHPWHGSQILGGMWGIRHGCLPEFGDLMRSWNPEDRWQTDQEFLNQEIYPRVVDDAMVHASFLRMESHAKDFPSLRNGLEFIGQVFDEHEATVPEHLQALASAL